MGVIRHRRDPRLFQHGPQDFAVQYGPTKVKGVHPALCVALDRKGATKRLWFHDGSP
ncbi:hypothetical protein RGUI_4307 (plasmid) [Rhodovulum sp. P5]|nr:hypothetical protein RGUI_4307 [Rhodovulum sp. P5]